MGFFAFFLILAALVLTVVGVVIGLMACVILGIMTAMGIVSSSLWIGFRRRRPAAGIRAFLIQGALVLGLPAGAALVWLAHSLFAASGGEWALLFCGAVAGGGAAVAVALAFDSMLRRTARWVSMRCDHVVATLQGRTERGPIPEPPLGHVDPVEPEMEVLRPEKPRPRACRATEMGMHWP